jgi:hypothetical protein
LELLVFVAAWATVAGVSILRAMTRPEASPWHGLASASGLTEIRRVNRYSTDLEGRFGSLEVRLASDRATHAHASALLVIRGLCGVIAISREGLAAWVDRTVGGGREIRIGDEAFDRALYLQGDERLSRALLDAETRKLLQEAFSGLLGPAGASERATLKLFGGELHATFADGLMPKPETVRWLLDVGGRLQEPSDVMDRLVENADRDPLPEVRRLILRTLQRTAPTDPATRRAIERAASGDTAPQVRLQAALWLGPEGWPTLTELASDPAVEDSVSAQAIEALGEQMPLEVASRVLEHSSGAGRVLTTRAAVVVLGRGGEVHVASIARAARRSPAVAAAAATALGQTGAASAEAALLALLDGGAPEVRLAAVESLGHVGSAASVLPLQETARESRGRVRNVALESVVRIRSRLTGADPGQLSLAAGSEGHLAMADAQRGQVTLPEPGDAT